MDNLPNIVVIVIDCLRKDYAKPLEDVLAKIGFVCYDEAIAPAPWTIPSHASMFTGLYPAFHGAHETKDKKIPQVHLVKTNNLMTFRLKELGYETTLLTANFFVHPHFGFIGFDHVCYIPPILEPSFLSKTEKETLRKILEISKNKSKIAVTRSLLYNKQYRLLVKCSVQYLVNKFYRYLFAIFKNWPTEKGITQIINCLDKYLKKREKLGRKSNNFIFINLIEMHEPYFIYDDLKILSEHLKTNTLDVNIATKWKIKYSREITYVTKKIANLIYILKKHKIFDNSLIIITSDHGQLLGEHGRIGHGNFLYDELLRVPLLIKYPKETLTFSKYVRNSWISLTHLKYLILSLVENNSKSDELLFSDIAFSESYGIAGEVSGLTEKERKNIEQLEKYRIAIYYKNFKGIFNVTDWKFEEIISYDPKIEVSKDIVRHMKKEVVKFLKTQLSSKFQKIKI